MDEYSKQATKVLAALAESNNKGKELGRHFQSMPEVEKVSTEFDGHRNHSYWEFGSGSPYILTWYVDVALKNGKAIWWSLDVQWDEEKWIIQPRVEVPGDNGPNTLKEFPERTARTVDELVRQLDVATSELLDSAKLIESQM